MYVYSITGSFRALACCTIEAQNRYQTLASCAINLHTSVGWESDMPTILTCIVIGKVNDIPLSSLSKNPKKCENTAEKR